jgi:hypothetical protein
MQDRYGPEAQRVVRRALELSNQLPEPLRLPQATAIINVVHEKLFAYLKELAMCPDLIPEGPAARLLRLDGFREGEAKGKAESVLTILATRGLTVTEAQRSRLLACTDLLQLDHYLQRALTAESTEDVLR